MNFSFTGSFGPSRLLSGIFLIIFLLFVFQSCNNSSEHNEEKRVVNHDLDTLDYSQIRSGDLIIKRGKGYVSNMIVKKMDEKIPLSHCGILVRNADSIIVIHSVARELTGIDGVQEVGFTEFLKDCIPGYLYIVRYKGDSTGNVINAAAHRYLDRHAPFDYDISYNDSSRVNCSELIYQSLPRAEAEKCLKTKRIQDKKPITFNSFLDTTYFHSVYSN